MAQGFNAAPRPSVAIPLNRFLPPSSNDSNRAISSPSAAVFLGAGLTGQYFNNLTLSGPPAFTRTDVRVDANWNGASPSGSSSQGFSDVAGTNWSAKWTGNIIPTYSEAYTFTTMSDDGVRLVVNGKTLINDWTDHPVTTDTGSINLVAGQAYSIELDYYQGKGGSELHLLWSSPSTPQEVIEPATPIGINAGTAADYDNSLMFADAVKMSRGWTSLDNIWGNPITPSPTDWPTTDAALPLFDAADRKGTYALTFNGAATSAPTAATTESPSPTSNTIPPPTPPPPPSRFQLTASAGPASPPSRSSSPTPSRLPTVTSTPASATSPSCAPPPMAPPPTPRGHAVHAGLQNPHQQLHHHPLHGLPAHQQQHRQRHGPIARSPASHAKSNHRRIARICRRTRQRNRQGPLDQRPLRRG